MRYINLLVALVLSFALIGTAACTSSEDDLSGSAGDIGASDEGGDAGAEPGGGDAGAEPGGGDDAARGGVEKPGKGGEGDVAAGLLADVAASLKGPMTLDGLVQLIENLAGDPNVAKSITDDLLAHIEGLAGDGDAVAQALVDGAEASAEDLQALLLNYIDGLGGSAGGDAGAGGGDSSSGGDPGDTGGALNEQEPSERTARDILVDNCGSNDGCVKDVEDFSAWVDENIDSLDSCFANFNDDLSNLEISGQQPLKTTHCSVETVQAAYTDYQSATGGDAGGDAGGDDKSKSEQTPADVIAAVAAELGGDEVDLKTLSDMILTEAVDPVVGANAVEMMENFVQKMAGQGDATAEALIQGGTVNGDDAATLLGGLQ